jgi:CRISPR-associated protein Cmr3
MAIMSKFEYLITISPLGLMYGSAGAFLSPENLVGRSGSKFPPDAATVAGLFFNANRENQFIEHEELQQNLVITGPFWANRDTPKNFYVPIPWYKILGDDDSDEWTLLEKEDRRQPIESGKSESSSDTQWCLGRHEWHRNNKDLQPEYSWQLIDNWEFSANQLHKNKGTTQAIAKAPWEFVSFLHPKIKADERHVVEQDGLFLENAVQLDRQYCLVYLSNYEIPDGWYRFGGEGHLVELETQLLPEKHKINLLLEQKIQHACALITPGVWGSNKLSYRYPKHASFPRKGMKLLTDKAIPYRYRLGHNKKDREQGEEKYKTGRLSRGRYAMPPGSVYVFKHPLNMNWWDFPDDWFPKEGFPLKHLGCSLCLPVKIQGVPQ